MLPPSRLHSLLPVIATAALLCSGACLKKKTEPRQQPKHVEHQMPACGGASAKIDAAPARVEATGIAYRTGMPEEDTQEALRARAVLEARRMALLAARREFVERINYQANGQIIEDLAYANVGGKILEESILMEGWADGRRNGYEVRLQVRARPEKSQGERTLQMELWLSANELRAGEDVKIYYRLNRGAYVYIFSVAADCSVRLLFPNRRMRDHHAPAHRLHSFPPQESNLRLYTGFLPGDNRPVVREWITAVATEKKTVLLPPGKPESWYLLYAANQAGMIRHLSGRLSQLEPPFWIDKTVEYRLVR